MPTTNPRRQRGGRVCENGPNTVSLLPTLPHSCPLWIIAAHFGSLDLMAPHSTSPFSIAESGVSNKDGQFLSTESLHRYSPRATAGQWISDLTILAEINNVRCTKVRETLNMLATVLIVSSFKWHQGILSLKSEKYVVSVVKRVRPLAGARLPMSICSNLH